jgi:hypothetical protein
MNRRFFLKALAAIGLMPIPAIAVPALVPALYQSAPDTDGIHHRVVIRYRSHGVIKAMYSGVVAWPELSRDRVMEDLSLYAGYWMRKQGIKAADIVLPLPGMGDGEIVYLKYQEKLHG